MKICEYLVLCPDCVFSSLVMFLPLHFRFVTFNVCHVCLASSPKWLLFVCYLFMSNPGTLCLCYIYLEHVKLICATFRSGCATCCYIWLLYLSVAYYLKLLCKQLFETLYNAKTIFFIVVFTFRPHIHILYIFNQHLKWNKSVKAKSLLQCGFSNRNQVHIVCLSQ